MKHISQLFSAAIIMIVCFLSVTQSNAQNCPTDIFPTNIPWSYGCKYYNITWPNGNTCETWVCYCVRMSGNTKQIHISGIGYSINCAGDNHSEADLRIIYERAAEVILNDAEVMGACPPCGPNPPQVVEFFYRPCAEAVQDNEGNWSMVPCQTFGFCKRTYTRCCSPITGETIINLISTTSTNICNSLNPNCKSLCD